MRLYLAKHFYVDLDNGVICFKGSKRGDVVCEPLDVERLDKAVEFVREYFEEAGEEEVEEVPEEEIEEELMEVSEEIE